MSRGIRNTLAVLVAVFVASAVEAQSPTPSGPRVDAARAGISIATTASLAPAALPQDPSLRQRGMPQMIIGGVAIVGGALVGGDAGAIVSLAGLGYGIYGLYLYLN